MLISGLLATSLVLGSSCSTLNTAVPLDPGEHRVGLTMGGALVHAFDTVIPLPNAILEGQSGLPTVAGRATDVNYGLNLTGLAFGQLGVHLGASHMLFEGEGSVPDVSVATRFFVVGNHLDEATLPETRGLWVAEQLEVTASYGLGPARPYAGLAQYFDFREPHLLLTPYLGCALDPGLSGGLGFHIEGRYFAVNQVPEVSSVKWYPSTAPGALGVTLGMSYAFGGGS